jgi:hypothetical protein
VLHALELGVAQSGDEVQRPLAGVPQGVANI